MRDVTDFIYTFILLPNHRVTSGSLIYQPNHTRRSSEATWRESHRSLSMIYTIMSQRSHKTKESKSGIDRPWINCTTSVHPMKRHALSASILQRRFWFVDSIMAVSVCLILQVQVCWHNIKIIKAWSQVLSILFQSLTDSTCIFGTVSLRSMQVWKFECRLKYWRATIVIFYHIIFIYNWSETVHPNWL